MDVFTQISMGEHLFNVEPFCFGPTTGSAAKKNHFGVLGFVGKPARDGHCFGDGRVSPQFKVSPDARIRLQQ